uniref:DNA polymerase I n=1 Tax=Lygus hesperus TaxID=30085 RepID=A0A0A9XE23_LYGHE
MLKTAFPQMDVYRQRVLESARQYGFVRTLAGRVRYLPEINSVVSVKRTTAERQAFNTVVQGSAADVMKMAMIAMEHDVLSVHRDVVHLLTQIHDEVVFAVRKSCVAEMVRKISHVMSHATSLLVPLTVTAKVGPSLSELEE